MRETKNIGPIDLYSTANGDDVYRGDELIARVQSHGWTRYLTTAEGSELGRLYRVGHGQWDASAFDAADDGYRLLGTHLSIEAAIIAILRSE